MIEGKQEKQDSMPVTWAYRFAPWAVDAGVSPLSQPPGTIPIATGVDGRIQGVLRRYLGNIVLDDIKRATMPSDPLTASGNWNYTVNTGELTAALADADNTIFYEVFPFEITQHSTTSGKIAGFVVRMKDIFYPRSDVTTHQATPFVALITYDPTAVEPDDPFTTAIPGANRLNLVIPRIPRRDPTLYRGTDIGRLCHYADSPSETTPLASGTKGNSTTAQTIVTNNPITVYSNSRFIYIASTKGDFTPIVMWFKIDPTEGNYSHPTSHTSSGWHWEPAGPRIRANDWKAATTYSVTEGAANSGWARKDATTPAKVGPYYQAAFRLVDTFRGRYTDLSNRDQYPVFNVGATNDYVYHIRSIGRFATDAYNLEFNYYYPYYECWATLASNSSPGGYLWYVDRKNSLAHGSQPVNNPAVSWYDSAGSLIYAKTWNQTDSTHADLAFTTADAFVTTETQLSEANVFYDDLTESSDNPTIYQLTGVYWQGTAFLITDRIAQGKTDNPYTDDYAVNQTAVLKWSPLHRTSPENWPPGNEYITKLRVDKPLVLQPVGDYLYVIGDGPWIRCQKVRFDSGGNQASGAGVGLQTIEATGGMELVSQFSTCEVKGQLFGVFRDGAYFIEPSTGTPVRIQALDRIIRDTWATTLDSVQVGFDQHMDAVYILNSATDQCVILWMGNQIVTMLECCNAQFLRSCTVNNIKRVCFISKTGRFTYPRAYLKEGTYTVHNMAGQSFASALDTTQIVQNLKIESVSYAAGVTTLKSYAYLSPSLVPFILDGGTAPVTSVGPKNYFYGEYIHNIANPADGFGQPTTTRVGQFARIETAYTGSVSGAVWAVITIAGDATSKFAVDDVISYSPVVTSVVLAPTESSPGQVDGVSKRMISGALVVAPWMARVANGNLTIYENNAFDFPLFELGVMAYSDLRYREPFETPSLWYTLPADSDRKARTMVPRPRGASKTHTYDSGNPAWGYGYLGTFGNVVFPYVRCTVANLDFELKEVQFRGKIVPSESVGLEGG